jgi:hypothetical protein
MELGKGEEGKAEAENRGWGEGERNSENARVRGNGGKEEAGKG